MYQECHTVLGLLEAVNSRSLILCLVGCALASLRDQQFSLLVDGDLLFLGGVEDLEDFAAEWILIQSSFLEHFLNISQLAEIEFSFAVERVIIHF